MNVVIAGAGETGRYIAALLSKSEHNVVLIDINGKRLEEVSFDLDVGTRMGSATNWELLEQLLDVNPDLFIALTDDDNVNLVSCSIAKNLGYLSTIARVRDSSYLNTMRLDFARIFDVDYFISPELLVANEFYKYMISPGFVRVETFAHGAVQMKTLQVPQEWEKRDVPIMHLDLPENTMLALIYREGKGVIFPHGKDTIYPGDHITLIGETQKMEEVHRFFGVHHDVIRSVLIVGGSLTAINLAKLLEERGIAVRLIEKDYETCLKLSIELEKSSIIHHSGVDLEFLLEEKVGQSDVMVVCTRNDEFNVMAGLLGKEAGCSQVIVEVANTGYIPLLDRLGILYTPSPGMVAAQRIFALALSKTVSSLVSLYDNQAEIMEVKVSMHSKLAGIPISELSPHFPNDFLVGVIQNRGKIMIARGDHVFSPGDTVIVISHLRHQRELEEMF